MPQLTLEQAIAVILHLDVLPATAISTTEKAALKAAKDIIKDESARAVSDFINHESSKKYLDFQNWTPTIPPSYHDDHEEMNPPHHLVRRIVTIQEFHD